MNKAKLILAICTIIVFFAACNKDGETGPQGPKGTNGTNGINGNANVTSGEYHVYPFSGTTTPKWYGPWLMTGTSSGVVYDADFSASIISQDILDKGAVLVFLKSTHSNGTTTYSALPLPIVYTSSETINYSFEASTGMMRIRLQYSDNLQTHSPGNATFKIVAIAGAARAAHPNLNLNDYKEVQSAFNIKD